MSNLIDDIEKEQLKDDIPAFAPGDTVRVQVRVTEGNRERLQAYEGVVLAMKNRGLELVIHGSQNDRRRRRGTRFPDAQPAVIGHRSGAPRRCAPREIVLPARANRQGGAD